MRGELSQEAIVKAALELVDKDGLAALSMRRLGAALGVQGMAIYHHFASKEAVLDATAASVSPAPPAPTGDWRVDLRALSHQFRDALNAHPALLPHLLTRPVHAYQMAALREAQYAALRRAGLDGSVLLDAHRTWGSYLLGYLVVEQLGRSGGFSDADWRPPIRGEFPISAEVDAYQAVRDWDEQFDIGLEMIFDGIAGLKP
ncbi:TetR/AcrR family transcriptional regulator [Fodinicola acaciae]|uniref:TetR/AcrR family transcriptional regulator n=1 Tax=Fodinicola acaciae TaxID=2681555 RepID=UPI0013D72D49|nr:TetR family transcriptional regulator [Fodinicola acaciae]